MNIAIFTNNYLPNPYGVATSIETFREEFEKLGHQVFIFAPKFPGYVDGNKNVFRYPSIDIEVKFRFPLPIPYSSGMDNILENLDIDIIHSQHPNLLGTAALKWAKKKNVPLIFTWHTLYDQYINFVPFIPGKLAAKWAIWNATKYANKADEIIVPTESIIPIIQKWGVENKKITPIATGVKAEEFADPDREKIRKKYEIKNDEILLILITRITEEKNVEFLLESLKDILKKENVKFILGGEGYLIPKLKQFTEKEGVGNKIIFPGIISHKEIKDYLAAGDIFVHASKSETQGMIITDAMYAGLPIVAVEATGVSSLVKNGENGILVAEDKKEFQEAVEKLINDKDLRQKFSESSKKIARENFTSEICAQKMLAVYEKAIKNKKQ